MASDKHAGAMQNAEASLKMEGREITPEMRESCLEVLEGKGTTEALLRQIAAKDRAVREALASARIEGCKVTAQTERDISRILSGESKVEDIVREILSRDSSDPK